MKIAVFSFFAFFAALTLVLPKPAVAADPMATLVIAEDWSTLDRVANERLRADPTDGVALHALGRLAIDSGVGSSHLRHAVLSQLESCVAARPADALCQLGYGQVLGTELKSGSMFSALGSVGKVRDAFEAAVVADPTNYEARESLVTFYLQAPGVVGGNLLKARQNADAYAMIDGARAKLLYALIALQEDDPTTAEAELFSLPANSPDVDLKRLSARKWLSVGLARLEARQYVEAKAAFGLSLTAGAPSVVGSAHRGLGQIALAAGPPDESADDTRARLTKLTAP